MESQNNVEGSTPITTAIPESIIAPLKKVTPLSKYLALVVFIALPFLGGFLGYSLGTQHALETSFRQSVVSVVHRQPDTTNLLNKEVTNENTEVSDSSDQSETTFYTLRESSNTVDGRTYQVLGLYKKTPNTDGVKIATLGGSHQEQPRSFAVRPDKKLIAVNLETKLITVDVQTGAQTTVYTPKYTVGGNIVFSPDGTQLAFIDGSIYGQYQERSIYTLDLATNKATLHYSTKTVLNEDGSFNPFKVSEIAVWRKDDVLVMSYGPGKDCAKYVYSLFDLKTHTVTTQSVPSFDLRSADGMYIASTDATMIPEACSSLPNMCDDGYQIATQYRVLDPLSNERLGTFGDTTTDVSFVALSPDNSAVLYTASTIPEVAAQCEVYSKNITPCLQAGASSYNTG
jgi:dipeptidyl aminopeptidase/acylaminoacyl peptidase